MRRSTVQSLPLQLVFPGYINRSEPLWLNGRVFENKRKTKQKDQGFDPQTGKLTQRGLITVKKFVLSGKWTHLLDLFPSSLVWNGLLQSQFP
jgi:hypothetical protein